MTILLYHRLPSRSMLRGEPIDLLVSNVNIMPSVSSLGSSRIDHKNKHYQICTTR
ncbi:Uncharacterized protein APZ42_006849 [Daphnia magna]|uniref:Uncharacterized protein n=1 Tax=Daphnia magna TaxID=35525 RepID=A0A164FNI7_9CRUS|nr:Uncharacterized protein APZ42_006849 [Daphnia magna]